MVSLSYSAYSEFKKCGKKYKFKYVDRVHPTLKGNTRFFLEGDALHQILKASLSKSRPLDTLLTKELLPTIIEKVFKEQSEKGSIQYGKNETKESITKGIYELLDPTLKLIMNFNLDKPNVLNEFLIASWKSPLQLFNNLAVHGSADFVVLDDDYFELYDLKSSKTADYLDIVQLWIYVFSLEKMLNRPLKNAAFLMIRDQKPIYLVIDNRNRQEVVRLLENTANLIEQEQFKANPTDFNCKDCIFRNQCEFSVAKNIISMDDGKRGEFTFDELFK